MIKEVRPRGPLITMGNTIICCVRLSRRSGVHVPHPISRPHDAEPEDDTNHPVGDLPTFYGEIVSQTRDNVKQRARRKDYRHPDEPTKSPTLHDFTSQTPLLT